MVTRRQIRIKVMQALYAYFQSDTKDMSKSLRDLDRNLERITELYAYELKALTEIHRFAQERIEKNKVKHLPSAEDLNPNTRFVENRVLLLLNESAGLNALCDKYKVSWGEQRSIFRNAFLNFCETDYFSNYLALETVSFSDEKTLVKQLYAVACAENEDVHQFYEEKNSFWIDDLHDVQMMVVKTLKSIKADSDNYFSLQPLFKDTEDREFGEALLRKTISNSDGYAEYIKDMAKNWEMDRMAFMDVILMRMAITEFLFFNEIPLKVTLDEYIELAKMYSTPKSGKFINGVLDKLVTRFQTESKINKVGRGLL
ncbi:MAG: transcription antitermination factor NusB [Schleiferiaceae bacterium]|nr:transcription antitermination factor NusB [Schleiferiaceae bacterium]